MSPEARILVVDDEPSVCRMICRALEREGYSLTSCHGGEEGLALVEGQRFEAVLTDVQMPGVDGLELTRHALALDSDLQVVLVTGIRETDTAIQALRVGAADYLVKPFRLDDLRFVVQRAVEKRRLLDERRAYRQNLEQQVRDRTVELSERNREVEALLQQLQDAYEQTLESLIAALDFRDHETRGHSNRVVAYAELLGRELDLGPEELRELRWGSILHDIGKIAIPDAILRKPGPLDDREQEKIREHPELGYRMLEKVSFLAPALKIVRHHHEWWDGTGYPDGLIGPGIPRTARIFSVVDAFDAMTTDRPYRKGATHARAVEELRRFRGSQFEPEIVDAFAQLPPERLDEVRVQAEHEADEA